MGVQTKTLTCIIHFDQRILTDQSSYHSVPIESLIAYFNSYLPMDEKEAEVIGNHTLVRNEVLMPREEAICVLGSSKESSGY